jgi:hypothetical protein
MEYGIQLHRINRLSFNLILFPLTLSTTVCLGFVNLYHGEARRSEGCSFLGYNIHTPARLQGVTSRKTEIIIFIVRP